MGDCYEWLSKSLYSRVLFHALIFFLEFFFLELGFLGAKCFDHTHIIVLSHGGRILQIYQGNPFFPKHVRTDTRVSVSNQSFSIFLGEDEFIEFIRNIDGTNASLTSLQQEIEFFSCE